MRIKCVATYTNIFMSTFEETHIYPLIKRKLKVFLTYIDDVFLYGQALRVICNSLYPKLMKSTPSWNLILTTRDPKQIFRKTFNLHLQGNFYRQSYFSRKSELPESFKRSIPFSQTKEKSKILTERLIERGYNKKEVQQQISKAITNERTQLLNQENHTKSDRTPIIST